MIGESSVILKAYNNYLRDTLGKIALLEPHDDPHPLTHT